MNVGFAEVFSVAEVTAENAVQYMGENFWALLPALAAIVLALLTKEVYISLFLGIFVGGMFLAHGNPINALVRLFEIMAGAIGPSTEVSNGEVVVTGAGNAGILIFILELGILVALMNKAGGAKAFGNWVHSHIKSRKGALLATTGLGCALFMDDYFNRLTNGSIMQPVNDNYRISRAKTAFLVGSISVSVCILVPISSWASAIAGNIGEGMNATSAEAFGYYVKTIFCNFYPILMLLFLVVTSLLGIDLFGLYKHESRAITTGDLTGGLEVSKSDEEITFSPKGRVFDLLIPIAALIASCCTFLLLKTSDGQAMFDTNTSLAMGGCIAIILCLPLYLPRKLMTLKEYTSCFTTGFKSIADVIIILAFAWTLTGVCEEMNLKDFVTAFAYWMGDLDKLLPAIFFLAAMGVAFSTGTSWGTFGIMVPIVVPMSGIMGNEILILTISAVLSGSVFGDQVSPISDATILSAAAAKSNHLGYVKAQLPNALLIAAITFITFLVAGLTKQIWVGWIVALVLFAGLITAAYFIQRKHGRLTDKLYKETLMKEAAAESEGDLPTDSCKVPEEEEAPGEELAKLGLIPESLVKQSEEKSDDEKTA